MSYGFNYNRISRIISDTLRKVSKVSEAGNVNTLTLTLTLTFKLLN